jgi:hypothetical protein
MRYACGIPEKRLTGRRDRGEFRKPANSLQPLCIAVIVISGNCLAFVSSKQRKQKSNTDPTDCYQALFPLFGGR